MNLFRVTFIGIIDNDNESIEVCGKKKKKKSKAT